MRLSNISSAAMLDVMSGSSSHANAGAVRDEDLRCGVCTTTHTCSTRVIPRYTGAPGGTHGRNMA